MNHPRSSHRAGRGHSADRRRDPSIDRHALGDSVQPGPLGIEAHSRPAGWHPPMLLPAEEPPWHPPMADPASLRSQLELSEGKDELTKLRESFGNVLNKSGKRAYAYFSEGGWKYRVDEYLEHRDSFFGSASAYATYKETARTELDANKEKLRRSIEPNLKSRPKLRNWKEAQVAFYAWVRKAYENELGVGVNIPALISAKNSKKLEEALKQVQADYGKSFEHGGFNPRPIKTPSGYRLGTLSDHALGTAIDIRAPKNAQIEATQWEQILAFTGKKLDTATRKAKWKTAPKELHDALIEINDAFVSKLKEAVIANTKEGTKDEDALAAAIKADTHLTKLGAKFIKRWRAGFFELPWALVKELHEEAFVWGAVFSRLDLHHFELH